MPRISLCERTHVLNSTDFIYGACEEQLLLDILKNTGGTRSELPVMNIKVHDSAYSRQYFEHPVELDFFRNLTGDYSIQGTVQSTDFISYREVSSTDKFSTEIDISRDCVVSLNEYEHVISNNFTMLARYFQSIYPCTFILLRK